jgi:hypothetical protein
LRSDRKEQGEEKGTRRRTGWLLDSGAWASLGELGKIDESLERVRIALE